MNVNKSQATYKFLPECWATMEEDKTHFSVRIANWNTKKVEGIYKPKIIRAIRRSIAHFQAVGGDATAFQKATDDSAFEMYEPAMNQGIPDIFAEIDPRLFYCGACGATKVIFASDRTAPICKKCAVKMKQLQMVYTCECGYGGGVTLPYKPGVEYFYRPGRQDEKQQFKFLYYEFGQKKDTEMQLPCPQCGTLLRPKNAQDKVHFIPFTDRSVNLIDAKFGDMIHSKIEYGTLILSKWLGIIDQAELRRLVSKDPMEDDTGFEKMLRVKIDFFMNQMHLPFDQAKKLAVQMLGMETKQERSISSVLAETDKHLDNPTETRREILCEDMIEYDTVLYPKNLISLETAMLTSKRVESILNDNEIRESMTRFGASMAQLSHDIQIVNAAYGFTRRVGDPNNISDRAKKKGVKLKLNPFYYNNKFNIYSSILDTEGIVVEFDRVRILKWLIDNGMILDDIDFGDATAIKAWFLNHIDASLINPFSEIKTDTGKNAEITKAVYGLVHTLSHMLLRSAGVTSGLDKDAVSEMIFPNVPAIFLYTTSVQGVTLGSLAGLFEQNIKLLFDKAYQDAENCLFDPVCTDAYNACCIGCTYISDTSCTHFNKDLSRKYLYGGELHVASGKSIVVKKGFWR